jgi:CRP-like cAMP-binding protein
MEGSSHMPHTTAEELDRLDLAFEGNLLLKTFRSELRALLKPSAELVTLELGQSIQHHGHDVRWSYFPFESTMISLLVPLADERSVEVASIGREGAVGGIVSCGHAPAFARARVLMPGPAFRVPMQQLEEAKSQSPFIGNLFCRFSDYLLAQVMQSAACNAFHSIQERAARWLLHAQDRAGDRIELTQEAFAGLLGVQRTTVNAVIQSLQADGLVATGRGVIRVTDRAGLKRRACECYERLEEHFGAVIGAGGSGV